MALTTSIPSVDHAALEDLADHVEQHGTLDFYDALLKERVMMEPTDEVRVSFANGQHPNLRSSNLVPFRIPLAQDDHVYAYMNTPRIGQVSVTILREKVQGVFNNRVLVEVAREDAENLRTLKRPFAKAIELSGPRNGKSNSSPLETLVQYYFLVAGKVNRAAFRDDWKSFCEGFVSALKQMNNVSAEKAQVSTPSVQSGVVRSDQSLNRQSKHYRVGDSTPESAPMTKRKHVEVGHNIPDTASQRKTKLRLVPSPRSGLKHADEPDNDVRLRAEVEIQHNKGLYNGPNPVQAVMQPLLRGPFTTARSATPATDVLAKGLALLAHADPASALLSLSRMTETPLDIIQDCHKLDLELEETLKAFPNACKKVLEDLKAKHAENKARMEKVAQENTSLLLDSFLKGTPRK